MYGSAEELNQHVVQCLRRVISQLISYINLNLNYKLKQNGEDADEDEPLDVEGDSYEEYEWAGQRRVRASSLLEGGFAGII